MQQEGTDKAESITVQGQRHKSKKTRCATEMTMLCYIYGIRVSAGKNISLMKKGDSKSGFNQERYEKKMLSVV